MKKITNTSEPFRSPDMLSESANEISRYSNKQADNMK